MIGCRPYDVALRTPYAWARGRQERRRGVLVRASAGGLHGWGEVAPPPDQEVDAAAIEAEVARLTQGLDPADPDFLPAVDQRGPPPRIRCALATAWWDLTARQDGHTLGQALAAALVWPTHPSRHVPCNALVTGEDAPEVQTATHQAVDDGYTTLKLKLSGDRDRDLRRVRALREIAPRATLRLDVNGAWPEHDALGSLEELAPFGIEYVEQPVPPEDRDTLRRLTAAGLIDIALDESATDAATIDTLLGQGIGDVIIVKPQRVGGPDRALACVQAAMRHDVTAVVTNSLETSIGVHAALHVASLLPAPLPRCGLATSRYLAEDVAPPPACEGDRMAVPEAPGLGVEAAWT